MKRTVIPLIIVAVVALGLWGREKFEQAKSTDSTATQDATAALSTRSSVDTASGSAGNSAPVATAISNTDNNGAISKNGNAKASLQAMSLILMDAARGNKNFDRIVSKLKQTGQNPTVTRDGNPATGDMFIVRTQNPLPGTRYFHAQYFTDENKNRFVQHMSFEFKPGPTSMNDAVQTAMQSFSLGQPKDRKADFAQWDLDEDYILWIKQKSAADLKDDPFKAYDPKTDIGTVQITIELKIHEDEEHSGHAH